METVLIQLTTPKTMQLLKDLEALNLLKVLKNNPSEKLSDKYGGKLPTNIADEFQNIIEEGRSEWEKNSNI